MDHGYSVETVALYLDPAPVKAVIPCVALCKVSQIYLVAPVVSVAAVLYNYISEADLAEFTRDLCFCCYLNCSSLRRCTPE